MARIVYALSGQGRGHSSRVLAISEALRRRSHEVVFCCGGTAREIFESAGEQVVAVPSLRQVIRNNEVRFAHTLCCNWRHIAGLTGIVQNLAERFRQLKPDLVITDFEAFSPRAAQKAGIPVVSFNHQQVVTEMVYDLPARFRLTAALASAAIRLIAPRDPAHILLTSFFFGELRNPARTTLIPPIIRREVEAVRPIEGEHVLVYFNQPDGSERVLEDLSRIDASFLLYNFDPGSNRGRYPNLIFKEPSLDEFLQDLASSRAVICTAGFTLISESLYLGKPLLVVPNRGIFEQTLNALFLELNGYGTAVVDRPLRENDVRQFLENISRFGARFGARAVSGNDQAVRCIERVLTENGCELNGNQRYTLHATSYTGAATRIAKSE